MNHTTLDLRYGAIESVIKGVYKGGGGGARGAKAPPPQMFWQTLYYGGVIVQKWGW